MNARDSWQVLVLGAGPVGLGAAYPEDAALEEGDVIVEITPRHVFAWGLD